MLTQVSTVKECAQRKDVFVKEISVIKVIPVCHWNNKTSALLSRLNTANHSIQN